MKINAQDKLPLSWEIRKLTQLGDVQSGFAFKSKDFKDGGKYQVIRIGNLYGGTLGLERVPVFLDEIDDAQKSFVLEKDDLIFTMTGTMGKRDYGYIVRINDHRNLLLNQRVGRIKPNVKNVNPVYLFYVCQTKHYLDQFFVTATGGTGNQANVGVGDIRQIKIPYPPLVEQEKIAGVLGCWDLGIERLEKVIDAKRKMKKALCQRLLTGKKRFKEFKGQEWKEYRLQEVVGTFFSNVDKKSYEDELPVRLCNYMDVYKNQYITNDMPFMHATAKAREIDKFTLKLDDVIITKDSETPDDIANSTVVAEELENVLCGYHLAILRPAENLISGLFLADLLMLQVIRHQFSRLANGATRFGLGVEDIKKIVLRIPSIKEQQKIASVLNAADSEIELLCDELEALKNQKKGLMQKLLTGKIRVKV